MSATVTYGGHKWPVDKTIRFNVFGFGSPDEAVDAVVAKAATFLNFAEGDLSVNVFYRQGDLWVADLVVTYAVPNRARQMPANPYAHDKFGGSF